MVLMINLQCFCVFREAHFLDPAVEMHWDDEHSDALILSPGGASIESSNSFVLEMPSTGTWIY